MAEGAHRIEVLAEGGDGVASRDIELAHSRVPGPTVQELRMDGQRSHLHSTDGEP